MPRRPETVRDLFGNDVPEYAMTPQQRRQLLGRTTTPRKGFAAPPGTGPEGETCGSCDHIAANTQHRTSGKKTWFKCELERHRWTRGQGSDITKTAAACSKWAKATDWTRE